MADPAKTPKISNSEHRKKAQANCRETPCTQVANLVYRYDKTAYPPCVICVREGEIRQAWREREDNG